MALPGEVYVQSLDPTAAKPVATTTFPTTDGTSGAVQWMLLTDARTPIGASVFSYGTSNPQAVAAVDPTGAHLTVRTVWISNTPSVNQAGAPWTLTGSVGATQLGSPWSVTGSVQATQAGAPWTVTGSVGVTQQTSPWVVLPGSSGAVQFVVGSVSVIGSVGALVAGSVQATVIGSVLATQGGAPWSVTGSQWVTGVVSVTQASSPWIVQVACTAGGGSTITGSVLATQGAPPWTVLASVSQVTSPWIVQVACTAGGGSTVTGSVYATQVGAPWSVIGSVGATQTGSWRVFVTGSDGTPVAVDSFSGGALLRVAVYSTPPGGSAPTSVFAIQQGSWQVNATVTGSVGATQLGAPWTVTGSVLATQGAAPWTVLASVSQVSSPWVTIGASNAAVIGAVTGSVGASQLGAPWSVIGSQGVTQLGAPWLWTGSVGATQLGAPWTVTGSVLVQGQVASGTVFAGNPVGLGALAFDTTQTSVTQVGCGQMVALISDRMGRQRIAVDTGNVAVTGSVQATQVGAPWSFTGSVGATQLGAPWTVIASVTGQLTATASIAGNVPVTQVSSPWVVAGSVAATQAGAPWTFTGSVGATQLGSPWSVTGSTGVTQLGAPWTVTGSVLVQGQVSSGTTFAGNPLGLGGLALDYAQTSVTQVGCGQMVVLLADRMGRQRITVDTGNIAVTGSVQATQAGAPWTVTGSVGATQLGAWTAVVSVIGQPTVTASVAGQVTVTASVVGQVTATVSVAGVPTVIGSVQATQASSWTQRIGDQLGLVEPFNTSSTALNPNATYVGSWADLKNYAGAIVSIATDKASATDGVRLEYSQDQSSLDYFATYTVPGSGFVALTVTPNARYFRVSYLNGTGSQGYFHLQTLLKPVAAMFGQQEVVEIGAPTIVNTWVAVNSTAATVVPVNATRRRMVLLNIAPVDIYVGAATVTTSVGMKLSPGASITLHTTAALQAMTPQNSGFLCVLEEYY